MVHPSEIIYWEILPAIRKQIVLELKNMDIKQSEIAKILAVTPSAISQYVSNKRGEYNFSDEFMKKIRTSVQKILDKSSDSFREVNILVKEFENARSVCKICRDKNDINGKCGICFDN